MSAHYEEGMTIIAIIAKPSESVPKKLCKTLSQPFGTIVSHTKKTTENPNTILKTRKETEETISDKIEEVQFVSSSPSNQIVSPEHTPSAQHHPIEAELPITTDHPITETKVSMSPSSGHQEQSFMEIDEALKDTEICPHPSIETNNHIILEESTAE
ncbi:hypothetical protein A2U01_0026915, partial [Trifolium medium]|nr:hypothetical protein [Trifolium medium]